MKFTATTKELRDAITLAHKSSEASKTMPILENIHLAAKGESVVVYATNLEIFHRQSVKAEIGEPGIVVASAAALKSALTSIDSDSVTFEQDGSKPLVIISADDKFSFPVAEPKDFPEFADDTGENPAKLTMLAGHVLAALNAVIFAVDPRDHRPILRGVSIDYSGGDCATFCATEGRLIGLCHPEIIEAVGKTKERGFVVSHSGAQRMIDALSDSEYGAEAMLVIGERRCVLSVESVDLSVGVIEGKYFNFNSFIPSGDGVSVEIAKANLSRLISKSYHVASVAKFCRLTFDFLSDGVRVSAKSEVGSIGVFAECQSSGQVKVDLGVKLLRALLSAVPDDEVSMKIVGPTSLVKITGKSPSASWFIMPITPENKTPQEAEQ